MPSPGGKCLHKVMAGLEKGDHFLRGKKLESLEDGDRTEESVKKESVFLSLVALVGSPSKQVQEKHALGLMRSGDNRLELGMWS